MDHVLEALKSELEFFGKANDTATTERAHRMLNISRDTGEFLAVLVRATAARRVLEIGTSNGYSTLWLADATRAIGGAVTTIELAEHKVGLAAANFDRSGLSRFINLVHVLRPGGLLIVDNAISHEKEMISFVSLVTEDPEFATCLVPVGNGEFL